VIWLFAALLVIWGNLLPPLIGASARLPGGSWSFVLAGAALVLVSIAAARGLGLDAAALGLRPEGAPQGAVVGALAAALIAGAAVAIVGLAPAIIGRPVTYEPLGGMTAEALARHVAFFLPLGAVIPEELAFRGALLGALLRRSGVGAAVAGSAAAFALWHGSVVLVTVADTTLGPPSPLFPLAVLAAFLVLLAGGAMMAVLRIATGSLASTIAAHWVFNAIILVGLWRASPPLVPLA